MGLNLVSKVRTLTLIFTLALKLTLTQPCEQGANPDLYLYPDPKSNPTQPREQGANPTLYPNRGHPTLYPNRGHPTLYPSPNPNSNPNPNP